MSHDIRTPMNAIIGYTNLAIKANESEEIGDYLEKIETSSQHLLALINDVLEMSRIESGKVELEYTPTDLCSILEDLRDIFAEQMRQKDLAFNVQVSQVRHRYVWCDRKNMNRVLLNIISNAYKFTPEGGTITASIWEVGSGEDGRGSYELRVQDSGIGMSKEYLPRIFDAFSQEDSSSTNKYGSTGLGMPITRSIVELMNGTIAVESEKGVGTTFTVTVTLTEADHRDTNMDAGVLSPGEMSVLVIDDDPVACDHARLVLRQVGVSCDVACSGAEGLELVKTRYARREPYNLLLVDWRMPEMDGIETTRRVRQIVGNESAIIILTSYNWDDIADEARAAGVDTFVPKPLFAATVMDEFREAFKKKNAQHPHEAVDLNGRRVLLAEDVAVNAEIMMMILSMRGMEADHAENGLLAVEMFQSHEPGYYDAILMDMRMPVMDGLEATRLIRELPRPDAGRIPMIALTANAFDEDVQRSLQAGLNAHLSKPVEPEALFETMESLIQESRG